MTKLGTSCSGSLPLTVGLPQGSILGPLFFLIFINDLTFLLHILAILYADDTTAYSFSNDSLEYVTRDFHDKLSDLLVWCKYNQMTINWSKTKIMFLTKKHVVFPDHIIIDGSEVEVVHSFKLLGCFIDDKLSFTDHIQHIKSSVHIKLNCLCRLTFLSNEVKLQFFKSFVLPHFDYCLSLSIYYSKSQIDQLEKLYNYCLFKLCHIKLNQEYLSTRVDKNGKRITKLGFSPLNLDSQLAILGKFNLMPFKMRIFYRLSLFSYKILNKQFLVNIFDSVAFVAQETNDKHRSQYYSYCNMPRWSTYAGMKRLSYFLPNFVNVVIKHTYTSKLSDYKLYILKNFKNLYNNFCQIF